MSTTTASTPIGDSPLERVAGDTARVRILRHLSEVDRPREQVAIANEIGMSEAMVSRAKRNLLEDELIEETPDGLIAIDDVATAVCAFQKQLADGRR